MNRQAMCAVICLVLPPLGAQTAYAQGKLPLQRVQTIPMPGVLGRLDHLGVDVEGGRLFAAALGDRQNTVEVIDLKLGKRISSVRGQSMPQGVFYSADFKKLFVANGRDGTLKIFSGDNFQLLDNLPVGAGADHVGYDQATKRLYVGTSIPNPRRGAHGWRAEQLFGRSSSERKYTSFRFFRSSIPSVRAASMEISFWS
jgi:hypothetical protein